jgi:hypothetical protein
MLMVALADELLQGGIVALQGADASSVSTTWIGDDGLTIPIGVPLLRDAWIQRESSRFSEASLDGRNRTVRFASP